MAHRKLDRPGKAAEILVRIREEYPKSNIMEWVERHIETDNGR